MRLMPTTKTIEDRVFVLQPYSAGQATDVLLLLCEALAGPMSELLGQPVGADPAELASAAAEVFGKVPTVAAISSLMRALRKAGGADLLPQVLASTYYADSPLNSRRQIDHVFDRGPADLVPLGDLTWEVLAYQFRPFWAALQPRLVAAVAAAAAKRASAQAS